MEFCHVGQAGLKLLTSSDPSALSFQSAGTIGVSLCAWQDTVLKQGLSPSPRLECTGTIMAHCSLDFLDSRAISLCVTQAGLKLLSSSNSLASASQKAEISGMSHYVLADFYRFNYDIYRERPLGWCAMVPSWLTATFASRVQ
ncbi:hypothetical protein AAY473_013321, partial [Plecturocebus cupreus]